MSPTAVESIKLNVKHNQLEDKITAKTGNAIAYMYSYCDKKSYDVIDLDPSVARLLGPGHPGPLAAGVLLVLVGVLGLGYGTRRFRRSALLIEQGDVAGLDSSRAMVAVSVVLALTVVAALALLLLW